MKLNYLSKEFINCSHELELSDEQNIFINYALKGHNILVDACIGSGKTTAIQHLCNLLPSSKHILYLTYNRLLKIDAQEKIFNKNVYVQNYHGYAAEMLNNNGIRNVALDDLLTEFNRNQFSLPLIDILIIDEYQDIDSQSAEMIKYIKESFPQIQIIMVGDMCQKIYDYTSLNIIEFVDSLIDDVIRLKFSKCFRLSQEWARELGNVWGKNIRGVNDECEIIYMGIDEVTELLLKTKPEDILCLGPQQGVNSYTAVLNRLEKTKPDIFNKYTVYASIRDKDINMRPDKNCAIFTTYDSSKGLERKICVLFDWTCDYWNSRKKFSDQPYVLLRNIFCVAASRGKEKIIIIRNEDQLTWEMIRNPYDQITDICTLDISKVFDYRKTEFIDTCFRCLETKPITNECQQSTINIKRQDGLIDLSPCIGIYQEAAFFNNYDINREIELVCKLKSLKNTISDEDDLWKKILFLTSLETGQNRYQTQISDCFISDDIWKEMSSRLNERLEKNDEVQSSCSIECFNEKGEKIYDMVGYADVVKNGTVYELKFTGELSHSHYLQCALYMIALQLDKGVLWNIYTNEAYEIRIKDKKYFLNQLTEMITDGREKIYKGPLLLEENEDENIELTAKEKELTNISGVATHKTTNPIYAYYSNLEEKNNKLKIIKQRNKEKINNAESFAIVDTESTWNDISRLVNGEKYYDVAFSLGVIIADVNTCEAIEALYFIFEPECNEEGMYKNELELAPQEYIYKGSREHCIKIIKDVFKELNVNQIFSYNASYDYDHLPELKDYTWHEIMSKAAYVQYNPWIKQNSDVYKTGRLKRGYGVEEIYKIITQQTSYKETHCALYDVMDELEIMSKLKHHPSTYSVFNRQERESNKNKSIKKTNNKDTYVNSKKIMQCGLNATIVEYRSYRDIDIEFEDGVRVNNTNIDKWKRGTIDNPNIAVKHIIKKESIKKKESVKDRYIGKSRIMNCGMSATVIEYYNCDDITLKFEDGIIKKHCRADKWKEGKIRHP